MSSVRIPPLSLTFSSDHSVPEPDTLETTLRSLTGLDLDVAAARIDKQAFEQAASNSPLDLNWGLGEDGYFDRIAIAHEEFATSIRLSLTPAYRSARLDVPFFRDYLWWMTLKALTQHGAFDPKQAIDLPAWTQYRWEDEALPRSVKFLRELHEQKFNLVATIMENPEFKELSEGQLSRELETREAQLEADFYEKYGQSE